MSGSVVIDYLPESVKQYCSGYAVVGVDVIRATTTAVTAVALGRRCYPVPTMEAAVPLAARLHEPLLVGELGGNMPFGFDITNSPAEIAARADHWRPMILLSSSGTQLLQNATESEGAYLACLRNTSATIRFLIGRHRRVAVIGAGSRGEFREEDQYCCALVASGLAEAGYEPEGQQTVEVIERWKGKPKEAWFGSNSVEYLRRSNQMLDFEFIIGHIDDLDSAFALRHGEVVQIHCAPGSVTAGPIG